MDRFAQLGLGEIKNRIINDQCIYYVSQGSGRYFETLLEKEPETIEWINTFQPNETLWDIGANVGIYSIYAALKGIQVLAFEPHFANYFHLCANIMLNNLQNKVIPICLALTNKKVVSTMNLASVDFGTLLASFDCNRDARGNIYEPIFFQGMIGYDIDSFIEDFKLNVPTHFKIDVDGLELDIVKGGRKTFAHKLVKSASIELAETDELRVKSVAEIFHNAGLHLVHKKQNPNFVMPEKKDAMNFVYQRF